MNDENDLRIEEMMYGEYPEGHPATEDSDE